MSEALDDIAAERQRQIRKYGFTSERDAQYARQELERAALAYLTHVITPGMSAPSCWPFDITWWRPGSRRRTLVKIGAFVLAAIEAIDHKGEE